MNIHDVTFCKTLIYKVITLRSSNLTMCVCLCVRARAFVCVCLFVLFQKVAPYSHANTTQGNIIATWCQIYCLPRMCEHWMARSCYAFPPVIDFVSIQFTSGLAVVFPTESICNNFRIHSATFVSIRQSVWRLLLSLDPIFYSDPPMFGFCITVSICNSTEIMCGFAKPLQDNS